MVEGLFLGFERLKFRYHVEITAESVSLAVFRALFFWSWIAIGLGILGMIWMYFSDAPVVIDTSAHIPHLRTKFEAPNEFIGLVHPKYAFFFGILDSISEFCVAVIVWLVPRLFM